LLFISITDRWIASDFFIPKSKIEKIKNRPEHQLKIIASLLGKSRRLAKALCIKKMRVILIFVFGQISIAGENAFS